MKKKCAECKAWREVIVLLIQSLPPNERSLVCAKLGTMPMIWKHLSSDERAHVNLILAADKARKKEGV